MSDEVFVDGSGWISDESDFYGSERLQAKLERRVAKGPKRALDVPFSEIMAKRVKLGPLKEDTTGFDQNASPSINDKAARTSGLSDLTSMPPSTSTVGTPKPAVDALAFLKSRPQLANMQAKHVTESKTESKPAKREGSHNAAGKNVKDLVECKRFQGNPAAWQQGETVEHFLRRLPVAEPETAKAGPWLWVRNPKISYAQQKHDQKMDLDAFMEAANDKLETYEEQIAKVESTMAGKAPGTITRKLRPYREQLEDDLLSLAVKHHVTSGKWMFFPSSEAVPRVWRLIAEATAAGKLGPTTKVATYDPSDTKDERVICVYTYDFSDTEDVRRVLKGLEELDLVSRNGKPIYYKCDAYTYLQLNSGNPYKIRASLYSSKEMFDNSAKAKEDGPIVRLKKRNGTLDSFLSS